MAGYANPMIVVDSADFDGTNDYMTRGADLTGTADSKRGIISYWLRIDGMISNHCVLFGATTLAGSTSRFRAGWGFTSTTISVLARNAAGTDILDLTTASLFSTGATWLHFLSSWDLATAGARSIYINDVSDLSEVTFTNDSIDYTLADWSVGAFASGTSKFNGCVADLYFAPGQYLDFSLVYNRRKFISASGKPVHLGTTGALPTGTAPIVYQHLADAETVADFATNRGTGGNFSITGTLETGSTSPSD